MNVSFRIIGHNIKTARKACALTQEQLSERIGLSPIHYGRIERGQRAISLALLCRIADALNTSVLTLLQGGIPDTKQYPILFESPDPETRKYGEYVLLLLDAYRDQIRSYDQQLKEYHTAH